MTAHRLVVGLVCWLAFNGLVLLSAWASYRRSRVDEFDHFLTWEAEFRSSREAAIRQHPTGGSR